MCGCNMKESGGSLAQSTGISQLLVRLLSKSLESNQTWLEKVAGMLFGTLSTMPPTAQFPKANWNHSIPVTLTFEQATGKNVLLLPMGSSTDAAHSINEKLDKRNYIQGTKLLGAYLHYVAEEPMNAWESKLLDRAITRMLQFETFHCNVKTLKTSAFHLNRLRLSAISIMVTRLLVAWRCLTPLSFTLLYRVFPKDST